MMNDDTFSRVLSAIPEGSVVDRIEQAIRVTEEVARVRPVPYCRANVAPPSMGGYTPCMAIMPCPLHRTGSHYREVKDELASGTE